MPRKKRSIPIPACFTCTKDPRQKISPDAMPQANELDARNWSITQVKHWVRKVLPQYENQFEEECVSGMELLDLTLTDLKEMGIKAMGHRKKFMRELEKLRVESGVAPRQEKVDEHTRNSSQLTYIHGPRSRGESVSYDHMPMTPSVSPGLTTPVSSQGAHSPFMTQSNSQRAAYLHPQNGGAVFAAHNSYGAHHPQQSISSTTSASVRYHHDSGSSQSSNFFTQHARSFHDEEFEAHRILDHQTYQDFFAWLGPDPRSYEIGFKALWKVMIASELPPATCEEILQRCEIQETVGLNLDTFIRVMKCVYFAQQNIQPMILDMDKLHLTHTDTLPRFRPGFLDHYSPSSNQSPSPSRIQHELSFSLSDDARQRGTSDDVSPGARHPDKQTIVNVSEVFSPASVTSTGSRGRETSSTSGVIETPTRRRRGRGRARAGKVGRANSAKNRDQSITELAMSLGSPSESKDVAPYKYGATETDIEEHDDRSVTVASMVSNSTRELTQVRVGDMAIPPPPNNPPPRIEYGVNDGIPPPPSGPQFLSRESQDSRRFILPPQEKICMKNLPPRIVNDDDELMCLQSIFEGLPLIGMDVYDSDCLVICRLGEALDMSQLSAIRDSFVSLCREIQISPSEMRSVMLTAGDFTLYPLSGDVSSQSSLRTPIRRGWGGSQYGSEAAGSVIIREESATQLSQLISQQSFDFLNLYEELERISYSAAPSSPLRKFDIAVFIAEQVSMENDIPIEKQMKHKEAMEYLSETRDHLSTSSAKKLLSVLRSCEDNSVSDSDPGVDFLCSYPINELISVFKNLEATRVQDLFGMEAQASQDYSRQGYVGIVIDGLPDDLTTDQALEEICSQCFENMALNIEVRERVEVEDTREPIHRYESSSLLRITFRAIISEHSLRQMQLNLHEYLMEEYFEHSNDPSAIECVFMEAHTSDSWQGVSLQPDQRIEDLGDVSLTELVRKNSQHKTTSI